MVNEWLISSPRGGNQCPNGTHAKFLKVGLGQLGQNISVDFVRAERGFVLTKTKVPQPTSEVHDGALTPLGAYDRPGQTARPGQKAVLPSLPRLPLVRLGFKRLDVSARLAAVGA